MDASKTQPLCNIGEGCLKVIKVLGAAFMSQHLKKRHDRKVKYVASML